MHSLVHRYMIRDDRRDPKSGAERVHPVRSEVGWPVSGDRTMGVRFTSRNQKAPLLARQGMELLWTTLRFRPSSTTLSGLDYEIVGGVWFQVLDPHSMVVVPVGLFCAAPRFFSHLT